MTTPNLVELAEGLSEAQRRVLFAASSKRFKGGKTIMRHAKLGCIPWPSRPNYREFSMLWDYKPAEYPWGVMRYRRLTPLGQQVRNHLLSQGKEKGE